MKAIITGSFDPITMGHIQIIKKADEIFKEIYVVALINEKKEYMFTLEQKKELMKDSLEEFGNVIIDAYEGMTAEYMHKNSITKIVRGIRNDDDLKYEIELANKMKEFDSNFETILLKTEDEYRNVSSSLVKEKIKSGESLVGLVHPKIEEKIKQMYLKNSKPHFD